jgi:prepilin-type N-terminal cleavage/methylation domain-containing protein
MQCVSIDPLTRCLRVKDRQLTHGFSLLEMMSVVALIMIVASISVPICHRTGVLSREAVLRERPFTLRSLPDRFLLTKFRAA